MPSGYASGGVDFDDLFDPYAEGPFAADCGSMLAGTDLSRRYAHIQYGSKRADVGHRINGMDVSNLWAAPRQRYLQAAIPWQGLLGKQWRQDQLDRLRVGNRLDPDVCRRHLCHPHGRRRWRQWRQLGSSVRPVASGRCKRFRVRSADHRLLARQSLFQHQCSLVRAGIGWTVGRRVDQRPCQVRQLRIGQRQHFRRAAPCRRYRPGFHLQRQRQRLRLGLIDQRATAAIIPTATFSEHYPVACTSRHTPTPRKNPE